MIKKNLILLSLILTMSANTTPIFANSINEKLSNNTVYFDEISIANKTLNTLKKQQNKQLKEIESKQVEVDTLFYNKSSAEKNQKETKKRAEKATEDYNKTLNKLENAKELFTNNQNTILHLKNKITQNPTKDTVKEISTLKFKQIKQAKIVTDLESSVNTQAVVTKLTTEKTQKNEYKIDNLQKEYESKSTELSDSFENKAEIKQEINNINITVQDSQKKALELKKNSFDLDEESRKEKEEKYRLPTDEELKLIIAENERRKAEEDEAARLAAEEAARIEAEKKAQEEALKKAIGQSIADAALSKIGAPYVWGAQGPNTFDCSGLVWWACKQAGIYFDRTTAAGLSQMGTQISYSQLQPGDIITMNTLGYTSHVVIYIGNSQVVHAPQTGDVVKITSITPTKWNIVNCVRLY